MPPKNKPSYLITLNIPASHRSQFSKLIASAPPPKKKGPGKGWRAGIKKNGPGKPQNGISGDNTDQKGEIPSAPTSSSSSSTNAVGNTTGGANVSGTSSNGITVATSGPIGTSAKSLPMNTNASEAYVLDRSGTKVRKWQKKKREIRSFTGFKVDFGSWIGDGVKLKVDGSDNKEAAEIRHGESATPTVEDSLVNVKEDIEEEFATIKPEDAMTIPVN
ncbi:hypothetical protein DASC09_057950 [Saccharomycopsis crataegensis]|uniref:Uncharacterized protein n=1 Tax=Saccharomycopsis crataegensis TaxID=43959 RepID=A0AAV5QUS8_9ASCO|nr:hypothetical protein DASC09_057950 [Saccharomycopsis crataegensis]